ncbi:hypothetical protein C1S70_30690 (plasmid) [Azospirillum argentinense]|uniref:Uncharacterized protein n=1 Tax=Azospirillum argentinense TaxID=2970906 RepID=A0A2K1FRD0_9PROT|nr:hypothetical protein C1S70_30690 [Azospirillum argentinense]
MVFSLFVFPAAAFRHRRCPLPNPPPLRGGGDCRRFAQGTLFRNAGEGRGGGNGAGSAPSRQ